MKNKLIRLLKRIGHSVSPRYRGIFMIPVNLIRKLRYYILPVYLYRGKEKFSGQPVKIAYLGWDSKISNYWMERLLEGKYDCNRKKIILFRKVSNYLSRHSNIYDLALAETNNNTRTRIAPGEGFILPRWLMMQIDTGEFVKLMISHDVTRRIRKNELKFEFRNSTEDFAFFYKRMYLPYIAKRHGESAIILDYKYFLNKFKNRESQLSFILKDGNPVAGSYIEYIGDRLRMGGLGVLDGRDDIIRMGVIGAVYYYKILECYNKGIKSINIGGTSPLLADGLTRYKLSMGAKAENIRYFDDDTIWFLPLRDSLAMRSILKSNPFVYRTGKELHSVIFVDPSEYEDKKEFLKLVNRNTVGNIKETNIYCFDNHLKIDKWIKEEGYQNIQVLQYDQKFNHQL
jgi:hypothetical protein